MTIPFPLSMELPSQTARMRSAIHFSRAARHASLWFIFCFAAVAAALAAGQPPVVALTAPTDGSSVVGPATVVLTATATSAASTISSVTFYSGTTKVAAVTKSPYTYTWKGVAAGSYTLTAVAKDAAGLSTTSAPVVLSVTQDQAPIVSLTAPAAGSSIIGPTSIPLSATATSTTSTIASVAFYNGTTKLATITKAPYTYTWKAVAAGSYTLTAVATDSLGIATTSAPASITVAQDQPPVVTLVSPVNQAMLIGPTTIPLSATATSPDVTIASVAFFNGATKLATITKAPYQYSWKSVPAGTYTVTAVATDSLGIATTSAPVSVTVTQDKPPVVSLTAPSAGYSTYGPASVTLAATATSPDLAVASVTFYQGTTLLATVKTAPYQYTWKAVAPGSYSLTAVATDTLGISTTSAPVAITVNQDPPPVVAITAPASGFTTFGPVTVNLAATATSTSEVIKTVTFYQGATKIATLTKAPYQYAWKAVPAGNYAITAVATDALGITGTSAPVSLTINPDVPPTVAIQTPLAGATYVAPASIELTASASSPDVTVSSVTYYNGTTKLATLTSPPYARSWTSVPAGTYTLTAVATDSLGVSTTSAPVSITVASATTSTVKLTAPTANKTLAAPASVTLAATATATAGVDKVDFYAGSTLLGTATASPYQYAWNNIPAGTYYLSAVATDKLGATVTSAPITFNSDTPPVVALTAPQANAVLAEPATVNLAATVSSAQKISKVEFHQGSTVLATLTAAPYVYTWSNAAIGNYNLTAVAFDSLGISASSPVVPIQIITDVPPVVTLQTPPGSLNVPATSNVSLSFAVTDTSTSVQRVEIYRGGVLIATLTGPTSGSNWNYSETSSLPAGKYTYSARGYDATGAYTDSDPVTVNVLPVLPYLTGFESSDGYVLGSIDTQLGWLVGQGTAVVTSADAEQGSSSLQLAPSGTPAVATQTFASPTTAPTIVFADFYAKPVAESSIGAGSVFTLEGARFGFVLSGGQAVLQVFSGNGTGGGSWSPTTAAFATPVDANGVSTAWVRITARLDFTAKTWDIYANGKMLAANIPFIATSSTCLSNFTVTGDTGTGNTGIDDVYVGPDNPLFTDANNNGIDDAWESQYGLSLSSNNRNQNISGDGVPIIQDYITGANPQINTAVTPDPVTAGLLMHLRADASVLTDQNGLVIAWLDQSGNSNHAYQFNAAQDPTLVKNQINGMPSLSFNGSNTLALPYNMMQGANAGEIISVVKVGNNPNQFQMAWNFGTGFGSSYYNNTHFEDFGSSDTSSIDEPPSDLSQYFIYDTSISSSGTAIYRYNGYQEWVRTGLSVGFQLYPDIGGYGTGSFVGNISEMMVYNRVLTEAERNSVASYLYGKYAFPSIVVPNAPVDFLATALSSDSIDLSWTISNQTLHTVTTVYRSTAGAAFTPVAQINDTSSFTDTGLTAGTTYTYQISVQSYAGASGMSNASTVTTPTNIADIPQSGLSLWLRSTAGTNGAGALKSWADQSGLGNNAVPVDLTKAPLVVANQINGLPVVRFGGATALNLPQNMLQTATVGHIIAVVKVPSTPDQYNVLWNFGTGYGTSYINGSHSDDFGSSDTSASQESADETAQYFIYESSIDSTGNYVYRYDGAVEWTRTGLTVGFQAFPSIGGYGGGSLNGDIAEVIVYNRVLAYSDLSNVYAYLTKKYALSAQLVNPSNPVISSPVNATGQAWQGFTFQVTASNNPTGYYATGLPAGLTIDSTTGLISGSPFSPGTYNVLVAVTNASGTTTSNLTLTIAPGGGTIPATPSDVLAVALSSDKVDVSWSASYPAMHTLAAIQRQTGTGPWVQIAQVADASSFTDSGLTAGVSYTYQVTVASAAGSSGASNFSTTTTPLGIADLPGQGLTLWLRSTAGTAGSGALSIWHDQSGNGNDATAITAGATPMVVANQENGLPIVRFSGATGLRLPNNAMGSAQSGQIFAIVKLDSTHNNTNVLWNFGTGAGTSYSSINHVDDFGSSDTSSEYIPAKEKTGQYFIYDTAMTSGGTSTFRYNGNVMWVRSGLQAGFSPSADIGGNGTSTLYGDVAEVIVYNRVLSSQEQSIVYAALAQKYNLGNSSLTAPAGVVAAVVSTSEVDVSWPTIPNALYYSVERGDGVGNFAQIGVVSPQVGKSATGIFADTNAPAQNVIQYRVTAVSMSGASYSSAVALALRTPSATDVSNGLPFVVDYALGYNPTGSNSTAFPAAPVPVTVQAPPGPTSDLTLPNIILLTPPGANLN